MSRAEAPEEAPAKATAEIEIAAATPPREPLGGRPVRRMFSFSNPSRRTRDLRFQVGDGGSGDYAALDYSGPLETEPRRFPMAPPPRPDDMDEKLWPTVWVERQAMRLEDVETCTAGTPLLFKESATDHWRTGTRGKRFSGNSGKVHIEVALSQMRSLRSFHSATSLGGLSTRTPSDGTVPSPNAARQGSLRGASSLSTHGSDTSTSVVDSPDATPKMSKIKRVASQTKVVDCDLHDVHVPVRLFAKHVFQIERAAVACTNAVRDLILRRSHSCVVLRIFMTGARHS